MATTWLVQAATGSDSNGGTSQSVRSSGSDGVTNGTNTFTSASAAWSAADIGHALNIAGTIRLITAVGSPTSLTFSGATIATASAQAWAVGGMLLTLTKLLTATPIAAGDTAYVSGTFREGVTMTVSGSAGNVITVAGDVTGAYTGVSGSVRWTAFSSDTAVPTIATTIATGQKSYYTLQQLTLIGGTSGIINTGTAASIGWTFQDCAFLTAHNTAGITWNMVVSTNNAILFDRCTFMCIGGGGGAGGLLTVPTVVGSDYNIGFTYQNCLFIGAGGTQGIFVNSSGGNAGKGSAPNCYQCTFIGLTTGISVSGTLIASSVGNQGLIYGCVFLCNTPMSAGASGQLVEDYNILMSSTGSTNVTKGAHTQSVSSGTLVYAPLVELGQSFLRGAAIPRPFFTPSSGSPFMNFNGQAGMPGYDFLNRTRPAGGGQATNVSAGYLERHDAGIQEASIVDSGSYSLKQGGVDDQQFAMPVDAGSRTLTVRCKLSFSAVAATVTVKANPALGLMTDTAVNSTTSTLWQTVTVSFSPTAAGRVIVQLAVPTGNTAYWDSVTLT